MIVTIVTFTHSKILPVSATQEEGGRRSNAAIIHRELQHHCLQGRREDQERLQGVYEDAQDKG